MVTPASKYRISVCAFYPQSGIQLFAISDVEIAERVKIRRRVGLKTAGDCRQQQKTVGEITRDHMKFDRLVTRQGSRTIASV